MSICFVIRESGVQIPPPAPHSKGFHRVRESPRPSEHLFFCPSQPPEPDFALILAPPWWTRYSHARSGQGPLVNLASGGNLGRSPKVLLRPSHQQPPVTPGAGVGKPPAKVTTQQSDAVGRRRDTVSRGASCVVPAQQPSQRAFPLDQAHEIRQHSRPAIGVQGGRGGDWQSPQNISSSGKLTRRSAA